MSVCEECESEKAELFCVGCDARLCKTCSNSIHAIRVLRGHLHVSLEVPKSPIPHGNSNDSSDESSPSAQSRTTRKLTKGESKSVACDRQSLEEKTPEPSGLVCKNSKFSDDAVNKNQADASPTEQKKAGAPTMPKTKQPLKSILKTSKKSRAAVQGAIVRRSEATVVDQMRETHKEAGPSTPAINTPFLPAEQLKTLWRRTAEIWKQEITTLAVFFVVFTVYAYTCYPSVSGGDSGELIVTACNMGTAHPPGYPLYTMLSRIFITLLPFGHKAWRVNMCSVVCGSLAAAFLHKSTEDLTGSSWAAMIAALGFAFSPTVWLYSIQGEVFALNNLLCCAMVFLSVRFFQADTSERRYNNLKKGIRDNQEAGALKNVSSLSTALVGAFVCGLAMTNQHTTVLYVGPTVLVVTFFLWRGRHLNFQSIVGLSRCLVLGMSPYIYLPISASFKGQDSWGDQRSLSGFLHHFLRREYGTFQLAADGTSEDPGMWPRLLVYFKVLHEESLYVAPYLATLGLIVSLRSSSRVVRLSTSLFLINYMIYMGVFHYLANLDLTPLLMGVQARFWQQANLFVFMWAGLGAKQLCELMPVNRRARNLLLAGLCLLYGVVQLASNFDSYNHRNNFSLYTHGANILETFPKNSIVMLNGDINNNLLKYAQQCEGIRPDLRLLSLQLMTWNWFVRMQKDYYPGVIFPGTHYHVNQPGSFPLRKFLDKNYKKFKIYLCGPFKEGDDSFHGHYQNVFYGHCDRILRTAKFPPKNWTDHYIKGERGLTSNAALGGWFPERYNEATWEHVIFSDTWKRRVYYSSHASFYSNQNPGDFQLLSVAKKAQASVFEDREQLALLETSGILNADHYRAGGIIYGQYAKALADRSSPREVITQIETMMVKLWRKYCELKPDNTDIKPTLDLGINPYTGKKLEPESLQN